MLMQILRKEESGELASVWVEPAPGSTTATKLLAIVMKV